MCVATFASSGANYASTLTQSHLNHNHQHLCLMTNSSQPTSGPALVITPHVVNTINALPDEERSAISVALANEFILGKDPTEGLTPVQAMIYSMISFYVRRDIRRHSLSAMA